MIVDHAETAVRSRTSDGPGLDRAMDSHMRIAAPLRQVEGACTKRIAGAAIHAILILGIVGRLAFDHFLGWNPARPLALGLDLGGALELQAFLTDSDAIAARRKRRFDQVEELVLWIDDDRAGLVAGKGDILRHVLGIDAVFVLCLARGGLAHFSDFNRRCSSSGIRNYDSFRRDRLRRIARKRIEDPLRNGSADAGPVKARTDMPMSKERRESIFEIPRRLHNAITAFARPPRPTFMAITEDRFLLNANRCEEQRPTILHTQRLRKRNTLLRLPRKTFKRCPITANSGPGLPAVPEQVQPGFIVRSRRFGRYRRSRSRSGGRIRRRRCGLRRRTAQLVEDTAARRRLLALLARRLRARRLWNTVQYVRRVFAVARHDTQRQRSDEEPRCENCRRTGQGIGSATRCHETRAATDPRPPPSERCISTTPTRASTIRR